MTYRNKRTGLTFEVSSPCSGPEIEAIQPAKPLNKGGKAESKSQGTNANGSRRKKTLRDDV